MAQVTVQNLNSILSRYVAANAMAIVLTSPSESSVSLTVSISISHVISLGPIRLSGDGDNACSEITSRCQYGLAYLTSLIMFSSISLRLMYVGILA